LTCADFHPDGHLLALGGADQKVRIFDVRSGTEAAAIILPAAVKNVKFSENGTWLACVVKDSTSVAIFDIRKIDQGPLATVETGTEIDAMEWDYSGQFLASAGSSGLSVSQYSKASKSWSKLLKSADPATGVVWGKSAQSLLTSSVDGAVTVLAT
jgi:pre-mRNA-processing factor 19